jgi:hypothetical protein
METSIGIIPLGQFHLFELLKDDGQFGVYKKFYQDGSGRVTYIIAEVPSQEARRNPPSSVLKEFHTEAEALQRFACWKADPFQVRPIGRRKQQRQHDPDQVEFALGPYQSKQQLRLDTNQTAIRGAGNEF